MFIINRENIVWCLKNAITNMNFVGIMRTTLTGDITHINTLCAHLWYIYSYVKIIIWIPILWLVCKEEKNSKLARRIILGFGVIACAITDIQRFATLPNIGTIKVLELVDREILYVLLGYELFIHKDKIKNNKTVFFFSSLAFVIVNFIRYKIEMRYMVINSLTDIIGRENFMDWRFTSLNIISAISLFMALYSFEIKNEKLGKFIVWLGDKTFGIYLIHYLILAKVDLYKFEKIEKFYLELLYLAVGLVVTFVGSLLIVMILRKIKELFSKIFNKIIESKE